MHNSSNLIFKAMHIVAWIIFVGLCIEAGALLVNFIFTIYKPEVVGNLYQKLDLTAMYKNNKWSFFGIYSFILFIAILKAYLFYIVISLLNKLDLANPFNEFVSQKIINLSYYTFSIGLLSFIARQTAKNQEHYGFTTDNLHGFWADSQAFILMAAVIYIIACIFKKGVELQRENDLTV